MMALNRDQLLAQLLREEVNNREGEAGQFSSDEEFAVNFNQTLILKWIPTLNLNPIQIQG